MQQLRWSEDTLARADGTRDGCVEFVAGFAQAREDAAGIFRADGDKRHMGSSATRSILKTRFVLDADKSSARLLLPS
jgi:hypothetical protein